MKTLTITILIFISLFLNANAQWYAQYISSGNFINDIRFINRNTGWACGSGGLILKTTNGGTNWFSQTGIGYLNQIHPVNDSIAYACGDYIILKTTNGGNNWFALKQGPSQIPIIYGLWFNDENTGWFCGDRVALRTTNGGQTFIDSMFMTNTCNDIHFKNDSVGNIAANSKMFRTTNAGANWYPVILPSYSITPFTERVSFVGDTGWTTTTGGYIYRSTNYGISWDSLTLIQLGGLCIEFADKNTGYAGGNNALIYKTTDGGFNWNINFQGGVGPYTSIYSFNDSIVWAVGGPGSRYIMNTVNGGLTNIMKENINADYFILYQNYPNPFNPSTKIKYEVKYFSYIKIQIIDMTGRIITHLTNNNHQPGSYETEFDASNYSSGIFFYQMFVDGKLLYSKRMVLLK